MKNKKNQNEKFEVNKNYMVRFLLYDLIGVVAMAIAGLNFGQVIGFGVAAGMVFGILNEVHADLLDIKDILRRKKEE